MFLYLILKNYIVKLNCQSTSGWLARLHPH